MLENIAFSASMKTVDSALQEMYFKQLAEGGSLLIHCKAYSHNTTYLTPAGTGDFAVQITKPVSRLSTFIASMCPDLTPEQIADGIQYCNTFIAYPGNIDDFEAQLQLGSMRYPDAPIQGYTQAYWRALQAFLELPTQPHTISGSTSDHIRTLSSR